MSEVFRHQGSVSWAFFSYINCLDCSSMGQSAHCIDFSLGLRFAYCFIITVEKACFRFVQKLYTKQTAAWILEKFYCSSLFWNLCWELECVWGYICVYVHIPGPLHNYWALWCWLTWSQAHEWMLLHHSYKKVTPCHIRLLQLESKQWEWVTGYNVTFQWKL